MVKVIEIGLSSHAQRGLHIHEIPGQTDAREVCSCKFRQLVTTKAKSVIDWLSWGLTTRQPLWVILCRLPEKGRK